MIWKPCVRLVDNALLLRTKEDRKVASKIAVQLERMAIVCAIEASFILDTVGGTGSIHPHLERYRAWLHEVRHQASQGSLAEMPDGQAITAMESVARRALIDELANEITETSPNGCTESEAIGQVFNAMELLFSDGADNSVLQADFLPRIHDSLNSVDAVDFYQLAAHYKPNLRILEIGAGVGGTAESVLSSLSNILPHRGRHYDSYTITDVSDSSFSQVKERLASHEAVEFRTLDIARDPLEQGFEAESFDLIITTQALHATPSIATALRHVRKLLSPTGHLFIQSWLPSPRLNGSNSSWARSQAGGRASPTIGQTSHSLLQTAGSQSFTRLDLALLQQCARMTNSWTSRSSRVQRLPRF